MQAMETGDLPSAAKHIHRYLQFDAVSVKEMSQFVSESGGPDPVDVLRRKTEEVRAQLHASYDALAAAALEDFSSELDRLVALFPLVGERKAGIEKYGRYLAAVLSQNSERELKKKLAGDPGALSHVKLLTALGERIAAAVDSKGKLVETHYGVGQMVPVVEQLQHQFDLEASKIIKQFEADFKLQEKLALLEAQASADEPDPGTLPQSTEPIIMDLVTMIQCIEMVCRFNFGYVTRQAAAATDGGGSADGDGNSSEVSGPRALPVDEAVFGRLTQAMKECEQGLVSYYLALEEHVFRQNVSKAVMLNTVESAQSRTSTLVEDAFFVIAKSARRAMSTLHADAICAILNQIRALLEVDYVLIFKGQLKAGLGTGSLAELSRDLSGALQMSFRKFRAKGSAEGEADGQAKKHFDVVLALNNLSVSQAYTRKLTTDLEGESGKLFATANSTDRQKIESCLAEFSDTIQQFNEALEGGLTDVCVTLLRPRVQQLVGAMADYVITDEELASYDAGSPFVLELVQGITGIVNDYRDTLIPANYDALLGLLAEELALQVYDTAMGARFNRLGGTLFDKDIRVLCDFLSSITEWSIRGKFSRCTQMATLLSVDEFSEVPDYYGASASLAVAWRLSTTDVKNVLRCREDFAEREINALALH